MDVTMPRASEPYSARPRTLSLVGDVSRILGSDLRALWVPLGLWWALLLLIGGLKYPSVLIGTPARFSQIDQLLVSVGLTILSGLIVNQHPVHPNAFWRTRPWNRLALPVAKLLGIALFLWLPMSCLDALLASASFATFGSPRDFFISYAFPSFFAAAVACLFRNAWTFLMAMFGIFLAAMIAMRLTFALSGKDQPAAIALLMAVSCLTCLLAAYLTARRARAVGLALGLLVVGWVPALNLGARIETSQGFSLPDVPANPAIELTRVWLSRPEDRLPFADSMLLCASIVVRGIPDGESADFRLRGSFEAQGRMSPQALSDSFTEYSFTDRTRTESGVYESEPLRFASMPLDVFREQRDLQGALRYELALETQRSAMIEQPKVEAEQTLADLARVAEVRVDQDAQSIQVFLDVPRSTESPWSTNRTKYYVRSIAYDGLPRGFTTSTATFEPGNPGGGPPLPPGPREFVRRERVTIERHRSQRDSGRGATAHDMHALASQLRWQIQEVITTSAQTFSGTLRDVTLGDLACYLDPDES